MQLFMNNITTGPGRTEIPHGGDMRSISGVRPIMLEHRLAVRGKNLMLFTSENLFSHHFELLSSLRGKNCRVFPFEVDKWFI